MDNEIELLHTTNVASSWLIANLKWPLRIKLASELCEALCEALWASGHHGPTEDETDDWENTNPSGWRFALKERNHQFVLHKSCVNLKIVVAVLEMVICLRSEMNDTKTKPSKDWYVKAASTTADVLTEREKQFSRWGPQCHGLHKWMTILGEEYGECCKATLDDDTDGLRKELIQVAAVACAIAQHLDSNELV